MSSRQAWTVPVLLAAIAALVLLPSAAFAAGSGTSTAGAVSTALAYAKANPGALGVTSADVADLAVTSAYVSKTSGVTHVNVNQRHQGLEVFGAHATINVARGKVVFTGGALERGLSVASAGSGLDAAGAVAAAADGLGLDDPENLRVLSLDLGAAQESVVSGGGISDSAIPARLGWQPTKAGLVLAWQLVIDSSSDASLWNATVDAASGELLGADDWTIEDSYDELASTLSRKPGPSEPAPQPAAEPWPLANVNDGSSYRVFQIAKESPNDGPRTLVQNPADALASPFGWHDTDGAVGPEFTITRGNNNHAYLDQDANNTPDPGQDADGGPTLTFDFAVDFGEHSQAYRNAVTTSLFYGCNIVHDVTYQYGFDEPSGNFQANNYGRGGGQGDYVRCEAADGGGTNNANFSTPAADSGTPRMQMFLWPGNQFGAQNQVVVGESAFNAGWARFGPPAPSAGRSGQLVIAANNGCNAADYPAGSGFVAITVNVTSGAGSCTNVARSLAAQAAGAAAVIVADTSGSGTGAGPILTGTQTSPVGIPAVSVTLPNADAIRALAGSTATVRKNPAHPGIRDGDFDTAIIAHEYGHGVSLRLTGGPGINCLSGNEQAGEGWSDYLALIITMDPALDDPDEPRGLVPYVLFQPDRHGNGLRPRPYTRNMAVQPFTYDSIKTGGWLPNAAGTAGTSLALPHGLGHGWAAILWDMTWDLVDKHGFFPNIYDAWNKGGNNRAFQYVMDGLKLQGCGPGLVVASRAIINSADTLGGAEALDGDTCTVWASFARRGLGFSAVQGTTNRDDNTEAFDTHPDCRRGFQAPANHAYGTLRTVTAGDAVPLRFTAPEVAGRGLDVLAEAGPYSRLVDCDTLRTVDTSYPFITPRPLPVPTETPGNSGLTQSATGVYHYNWLTEEGWAGTCREVVVTRWDGRQHRAFFRFAAA